MFTLGNRTWLMREYYLSLKLKFRTSIYIYYLQIFKRHPDTFFNRAFDPATLLSLHTIKCIFSSAKINKLIAICTGIICFTNFHMKVVLEL